MMASVTVSANPSTTGNTLTVNFTTDATNITDVQLTKDGNNYIIVKFNVYSKIGRNTLNLDKFSLKIGKETYYINQKKCYLYTDIGPCYQKQYINSNTSTYILVFEVDDININKTYLIYSEDLENKTKIKLRLEDYILKS